MVYATSKLCSFSYRFSKLSKYQKAVSCSSGLEYTNIECPAKNHEIYWMKNDEKRNKIQDEELKMFTRNGGYFHINISNSLVLLEKYRVSVDSPVTVSDLKNKRTETDSFFFKSYL